MYLPNDIERQLPHHEMIFVEGGHFLMGSDDEDALPFEQPINNVLVSSFYLAKYPVTQALWKAVMGDDQNPSYFRGDKRPVEIVSWDQAQSFIEKINHLTGRKTYRLPSEAEWEYAARGGNYSKGYKYAGSNKMDEVGWYAGNGHLETKAVGQKAPNELGVYDLSGNVWEWIQDQWIDNYAGYQLGGNPLEGHKQEADRVMRGGNWVSSSQYCRVSSRGYSAPTLRGNFVGFRLALSLL